MKDDPDLQSIHDTPEFKAMLAVVKSRHAAEAGKHLLSLWWPCRKGTRQRQAGLCFFACTGGATATKAIPPS